MSVPYAKILASTIWNYIDPDRLVMTKVCTLIDLLYNTEWSFYTSNVDMAKNG